MLTRICVGVCIAILLTACGGGESDTPTHPQYTNLTTCAKAAYWVWCEKGDTSAVYSIPTDGAYVRMLWNATPIENVAMQHAHYDAYGIIRLQGSNEIQTGNLACEIKQSYFVNGDC